MLHIKSLAEGLNIFKALGSDVRIQIINLLITNPNLNMNELASKLNITNGALTAHIKKLEDAGIITTSNEFSGHGNQKKCVVCLDKILIDLYTPPVAQNIYQTEIKIGHYSDYSVTPTCGIASPKHIIGEIDDARYFAHPDHFDADILWFTKGYIEYVIPNFIPKCTQIDQISIALEISSEAPGYNDVWPSDIHFYLNDIFLGTWTSPGDFGSVRGIFVPNWWPKNWNQYGLLKTLIINAQGTFIDGLKISSITTRELNLDYRSMMKFKLAVPENAEHAGGLTLFGKAFGNYNQNINVSLEYSSIKGA